MKHEVIQKGFKKGHKTNLTHGMSKTSTYHIWIAMKRRCNDPKNKAYKNYGGRGIKVCRQWEKFENFYKDMGKRPEEKSLDRIDNNKRYCKQNCRWATRKEQQNNKRDTIFLTYKGKKQTLKEWSEELNINYYAAWCRYKKKLPIKKILS